MEQILIRHLIKIEYLNIKSGAVYIDNTTASAKVARELFNIAKENNADKNKSPIGTRWAVGSIDDIESLSFDDFRSAVGQPKSIVGKNLVLHLQEDDIYCSVKFTSWSSGSKGGFSYERTTP